jgi:serine beta-lactamase-like protein LACTB
MGLKGRLRLAVAVVLLLSGGQAIGTVPDDSRFAALDAVVREAIARTAAPGAVVVITSAERRVLVRAYGVASIETGTAVTADSLFQIGSVTKAFTAAAALSAAEADVLRLADPVGRVVTGLAPCLGRATLSDLLSHGGGFIDEPDEYGAQGEEGLAAYPRTWTDEYCLLPPQRAFSYSNSGYALVGLALQERTGRSFADEVRRRVLDPLGMTFTTFRPTEAMTRPVAVGHRIRAGAPSVVRPLANDARLWPAGTLYTSGEELGRFLIALANSGRIDGRQGLSSRVIEAMMTARMNMPTVGSDYGFGLELDRFRGLRRAGHGGTMTGYGALISVLPDRHVGVGVMTNGDGVILADVADRALELALGAELPSAGPTPDPPPAVSIPASELDCFVGSYRNPRRFTVKVIGRGGDLVLQRFGQDLPMRAVGNRRFELTRPNGSRETIVFGPDEGGRAAFMQMSVWALARVPGP